MPAISPARAANVATHACSRLYTKMMRKFLAFMSAVHAWPLLEVISTTARIKFVPPVSGLPLMVSRSTNQKLSCMLQLQLSSFQVTNVVL